MFWIFFKALLVGFMFSVPVGPVSILFIKKTLERGFSGLVSVGSGACLATIVFCLILGGGLSSVSNWLAEYTRIIQLIGGFLLILLGAYEFRGITKVNAAGLKGDQTIALKLLLATFLLTLVNPMAIISFLAMFSAFGGMAHFSNSNGGLFVLTTGVVIGSALWWSFLGFMIMKAKGYLSPKRILFIHWGSAFVLVGFGLYAIISAFFSSSPNI